MKIVILDAYTVNPGDLNWDELAKLGELSVYERTKPEEILERCKGAEIILTNKVVLDSTMLNQLPRLLYIGVLATGYNVVDLEAASRQNVIVTNIPAYSTDSVAQMTFAHLLNIYNRVQWYADENKNGRWTECQDFSYLGHDFHELAGKTMGVVGLGNIGMKVALIAKAFGMKVLAFTSKQQEELPEGLVAVDMDELFTQADVISLHCPLTDSTRHLVNKERLKTMKSNAVIINTGRGPLVNDQELAEALNNKTVLAYGADVITQEPPRDGNPLLSARNAFFTPHIAWATFEARKRLIQICTDNVKAFIDGKPVNVVEFCSSTENRSMSSNSDSFIRLFCLMFLIMGCSV